MKKFLSLMTCVILIFSTAVTVSADNGQVTYSGNAGSFVFEPGSEHSPSDLFSDFKSVMPGDILTQKITVKNDADNKVKVNIYLRSLGAHADSADFLSKLGLRVRKSDDNEMAYMFDAGANETAQLSEWVCLGTLYSGGEVNLDVILTVPRELDNSYQNQVGYLDWEFKVEELPAQPDDPKPPQTGDDGQFNLWIILLLIFCVMVVLLVYKRKIFKNNREETIV